MASTQIDVKDYRYFAGNQWRKAEDGQFFEVHEPYSGKLFARVAAGSRADARVAVDAASKAFAGWSDNSARREGPAVPEGGRHRQTPPKRDRRSAGA